MKSVQFVLLLSGLLFLILMLEVNSRSSSKPVPIPSVLLNRPTISLAYCASLAAKLQSANSSVKTNDTNTARVVVGNEVINLPHKPPVCTNESYNCGSDADCCQGLFCRNLWIRSPVGCCLNQNSNDTAYETCWKNHGYCSPEKNCVANPTIDGDNFEKFSKTNCPKEKKI